MKRAGVLGWPVGHSLSPRLHNFWLKHYNIAGSYEAFPVAPEDLGMILHSLSDNGFVGVNLTIPHKEQALKIIDDADDIARRIGAVNTIIIEGEKLLGTNTDAYGFIANLKAQTRSMATGEALVLGTGGAARAVCAGLLDENWRVSIAGRTRAKAEAIAKEIGKGAIQVVDWEKPGDAMKDASLLVNTTPLGMRGQKPLDILLDTLPRAAWVCDIVYNPLMTQFLVQAKARGNRIVTGYGMLAFQAQRAFKAWFGIEPEVSDELSHYALEGLV
jgi:shikimate dehydrogenase